MGKLDELNIDDQIKHMKAKGITFRSVNHNALYTYSLIFVAMNMVSL